jgi:hypothetical protein
MKDIGNTIKGTLLKRQEALSNYMKRKEEFLLAKENIMKEIEEASKLWKSTLEQMPGRELK